MSEAGSIFNLAIHKMLQQWSMIFSYTEFNRLAMDNCMTNYKESINNRCHSTDFLVDSPLLSILGMKKEEFEDFRKKRTLNKSVEAVQFCIEVLKIIFAHTIFDNFIYELCKVTSLIYPERWGNSLRKKQISFLEVKKMPFDKLRQSLLNKVIKDLEKESLTTKIDVIFQRCQPHKDFSYPGHPAGLFF